MRARTFPAALVTAAALVITPVLPALAGEGDAAGVPSSDKSSVERIKDVREKAKAKADEHRAKAEEKAKARVDERRAKAEERRAKAEERRAKAEERRAAAKAEAKRAAKLIRNKADDHRVFVLGGEVAAVDAVAGTLTVTVHGGPYKLLRGTEVTVSVDPDAKVTRGGEATLADLVVGDHVVVKARTVTLTITVGVEDGEPTVTVTAVVSRVAASPQADEDESTDDSEDAGKDDGDDAGEDDTHVVDDSEVPAL